MTNGDSTYPVVCELHPWNHQNATVACLPVIVANEGTFASGAFTLSDACHSEANALRLVKWGGIQDGNTIPAGLDLDGEMLLKAHG